MKHIHHIIPKHMGGSDDPTNLIELTVEEHAAAHKKLYEEYGREEDRMAWLGLSGQAAKKELVKLGQKLGRKKTDEFLEKKYGSNWKSIVAKIAGDKGAAKFKKMYADDQSFREKISDYQKRATESALSVESRRKRKETYAKIDHQKGSKNSNYGKMWITDGVLSKSIPKNEAIPDGWRKGRTLR